MGYGYWTRDSFVNYSATRGRKVDAAGNLDSSLTDQQIFTQRVLHPLLDPKNVMRECCDSSDHPASIPVILALDVTGSMGPASAQVAKKMNEVMTQLYGSIRDVEFMVMGIGDLSYDRAPIQISQFEADIRIAEQLDRIFLEHGGGGNAFESYTAAWYMGARHTRLDCLKRGKKGLIITMGDEPLNPYLPRAPLSAVTGDSLQADVETRSLYREVSEKYEIYHLHVIHREPDGYLEPVRKSFGSILPPEHLVLTPLNEISGTLIRIVSAHAGDCPATAVQPDEPSREISWETGTPEAGTKKEEPFREKRGLRRIFSW